MRMLLLFSLVLFSRQASEEGIVVEPVTPDPDTQATAVENQERANPDSSTSSTSSAVDGKEMEIVNLSSVSTVYTVEGLNEVAGASEKVELPVVHFTRSIDGAYMSLDQDVKLRAEKLGIGPEDLETARKVIKKHDLIEFINKRRKEAVSAVKVLIGKTQELIQAKIHKHKTPKAISEIFEHYEISRGFVNALSQDLSDLKRALGEFDEYYSRQIATEERKKVAMSFIIATYLSNLYTLEMLRCNLKYCEEKALGVQKGYYLEFPKHRQWAKKGEKEKEKEREKAFAIALGQA